MINRLMKIIAINCSSIGILADVSYVMKAQSVELRAGKPIECAV